MRTTPPLPLPVKRALAKLGEDIRRARLRRRISTSLMAQRAFISRPTLAKVEKGNSGVALGTYATVLFILGMSARLGEIAGAGSDELGLELDAARLPKRIRISKKITRSS